VQVHIILLLPSVFSSSRSSLSTDQHISLCTPSTPKTIHCSLQVAAGFTFRLSLTQHFLDSGKQRLDQ